MKITRYTTRPARIEMLPLIDIVFLLLVFFIYAMLSMTVRHGLQLDLPQSSQAKKTEETPLTLFVRTSGSELEIFLGEQLVSLAELQQKLPMADEKTVHPPEIMIYAEKKVSYQQLFLVLDELKRSGMTKISLQANPE